MGPDTRIPDKNRSQLEGLLEVAPPPFATVPGDVNHDAETRPLESWSGTPTGSPRSAVMETERRVDVSRGDLSGTGDDGLASSDVDALSNSGGRGHDPEGSGNLTEANRRCSILESMLKASRLEASTARRARDAAENTVRGQRDALGRGTERIVELEACLTREREDGEVSSTTLVTHHGHLVDFAYTFLQWEGEAGRGVIIVFMMSHPQPETPSIPCLARSLFSNPFRDPQGSMPSEAYPLLTTKPRAIGIEKCSSLVAASRVNTCPVSHLIHSRHERSYRSREQL